MPHEPLVPLALAVAAEADRLGVRAFVDVDEAAGAILVDGITVPEERTRMVAALGKARLRVEADHGCEGRLIVYPA